ncbi:hypothetical protein D3C80_2241150 [compost metagenome]
MLLHTARNISQLVSQDMIPVFSKLDKAADRIADRLLAGAFELPLYPEAAWTG